MADIKKLLNKKGWTGRELGILELTNMAVVFRQALEGKEPQPIVEQNQLRKMINTIADREQARVYNGYISIHEWLSIRYNIAQTQLQQAQLQYRTLVGYLTNATLAENIYSYIEQLPVILTQRQYEDMKAKSIEENLKEEMLYNVFDLVEKSITYYSRQLQKAPGKPNPLKAIRRKYITQPVTSTLILSRWNEVLENGYYTIEDGSGRRSDTMSAEEWQEATSMVLSASYPQSRESRMLIEQAKAIFRGEAEKNSDKDPNGTDYEQWLAVPVKWHYYENPPKDINKWDIIEQELLKQFYPADLDGSGDANSDTNYTASIEDFVSEFRELVTVILKDIDKKAFNENTYLSQLPINEWFTTLWSWKDLYESDFYGAQAEAERDTSIFWNNKKALLNGIAIVRASDLTNRSPRIDERGYYVEPAIKHSFSAFTLEAFFTEAEDYADNVDIVETARQTLIESYYHLKGYNLTLKLIADFYEVPDITIFQMDIGGIEDKIQAFNDLVPVLYTQILNTDYVDNALKTKKLQVLKDIFQPIDYTAISIPEENIEQAKELLKDFAAFKPENTDHFNSLLCILPEGYTNSMEGEGAY